MIENIEEACPRKEHREFFGEIEMSHILITVVGTKVAMVKIHQNVHLKRVHWVICKLDLNNVGLEKCWSYSFFVCLF